MNATGSALVETAVASLLAAALLSGSVSLGKLALDRRRSVAVSRYAAALAAAGLDPVVAAGEASDYAAAIGLSGVVSTRRYLDLPSASFYRLQAGEVRVDAGRWAWTERSVLEEE